MVHATFASLSKLFRIQLHSSIILNMFQLLDESIHYIFFDSSVIFDKKNENQKAFKNQTNMDF